MSWRLAALLALALGFGAPSVRAGCHAEVELVPESPYVGQAVLYRVHILLPEDVGRVEWTRSPAFAHVRTERLPGSPKSLRLERHGESHLVSEERRMLFAERAGEITLVAPELLCRTGEGTDRVEVPTVALRVRAAPEPDEPADRDAAVGGLDLHLTVTPRRVALGETVRVAVMVRGAGNVWDVRSPLAEVDWGGAEVFEQRPEVAIDRGRDLTTRAHFVADVVPRSAGSWKIPALRVPYFDPEAGVYRAATTESVDVVVAPRRASPQPAAAKPSPPPRVIVPRSRFTLDLLLIMAAIAASMALVWQQRTGTHGPPARALAELERAGAAPSAETLARILRRGLITVVPHAASATPEEIAQLPDIAPEVQEAAALLLTLDRARFDPVAPAPDAQAVRRALERL